MESQDPNTIVIIDDDIDLDEILRFAFENRGFRVKELYNGQQALDYLLNKENVSDIALVILDRLLPDCDGIDVLKKIVGECGYTYPVAILSKLTSESQQLLGLKFGSIDYIPKPFSLPVFIEKSISFIEHYKAKNRRR